MPLTARTRHVALPAAVLLTVCGLAPVGERSQLPNAARRAGTMQSTTPMSVARAAHTASVLPGNRVLIVGGFTADEDAAQGAEIYDAGTQRYTALPRTITLRHSHTATVMPDGKVLIVGGYARGSTTLASAELFDPSTNSFTATGSLHSARAGHVAVRLSDGNVLVAGGIGPNWTFLASAELYSAATGTFVPTGAMIVARESHTASHLQDGRVLIVGGHRGRRADITLYASAETYDASTGRFTRVGDMLTRRHKHDAVLLRDGRVLVTGGADERDSRGTYNTTELFDPGSGTFSAGPSMQRSRYKHNGSATLLQDGTVLIAGGAVQAEIFDPLRRSFTLVGGDARMAGLFSAVAPLSAGRVLVTGGYGDRGGPRASSWVYRP